MSLCVEHAHHKPAQHNLAHHMKETKAEMSCGGRLCTGHPSTPRLKLLMAEFTGWERGPCGSLPRASQQDTWRAFLQRSSSLPSQQLSHRGWVVTTTFTTCGN